MIPGSFDYIQPSTLDEALRLLSQYGDDAKLLAGGHSLIPAMKLRLAAPTTLIDLARINDLSFIREDGDNIVIGAMATHHDIESSVQLQQSCPLLSRTAAAIGDVQVRNRGTIGGSLAHADPAADWPAAVLALDASIVVTGVSGERTIMATDFFVDMMTTALRSGEIIREIRIAKPQGRFAQAYLKSRQPASGFAVVGVAVHLLRDGAGTCQSAAIGVTGVASIAYRVSAVEQALIGSALDEAAITAAASHATDGIDANGDLFASAEYRCHLARVYTKRAIETALQAT